jgi:DNA-binding CsgD family transcriptional regulator
VEFQGVGARAGGAAGGTCATIRADRARAAALLAAEVREIGAGTEEARQHLVNGLLRLLGCAIGGAVYDTSYGTGLKRGIAQATLAGFDREIMDVFQTHHTQGSDYNPFHGAVMRRLATAPAAVLTSSNSEMVARGDWDGSEWINEYVRPARVAHFICTIRIVRDHAAIGCGLMRAAGDPPFTAEDCEVLHLVHLGVGRLFVERQAELPPRVRETLEVLLTGAGDKEIAGELGISPHTVRQYVKVILKAYGVESRAQLIARMRR